MRNYKNQSIFTIVMSDTTNINDLVTDPIIGNNQENVNLVISEKQMEQSNDVQDKPHGINLDDSTISQIVSGIQKASNTGVTQLPSRDIPMNTTNIVNDPCIQPGYIPPTQQTNYIETDITNEEIINNYNKNKQKMNTIDEIYYEYQTPILLIILYFLFQLPFIRKFLFAYLPFLFNMDGNLNLNGNIFKSVLFGIIYYILLKILETFSKF